MIYLCIVAVAMAAHLLLLFGGSEPPSFVSAFKRLCVVLGDISRIPARIKMSTPPKSRQRGRGLHRSTATKGPVNWSDFTVRSAGPPGPVAQSVLLFAFLCRLFLCSFQAKKCWNEDEIHYTDSECINIY